MSARMSPAQLTLIVAVTLAMGLNFVVLAVGLRSVPPLLFTALRFLLAAVPAVLVYRHPGVPWRWVFAVSLTLAVGQQGFLSTGLASGMPPGLSSLVLQGQAPFTAGFAAAFLHERLTVRQLAGLGTALLGIVGISVDLGQASPIGAFLQVLGAAAMWGLGNVTMRRAQPPDALRFIVWVSAASVLPLLALSILIEGPTADLQALRHFSWPALGAVAYVALVVTLGAFSAWAFLIGRHGASTVAPFALLVPVFGMSASAILLGESFSPIRLGAAGLVIGGVLLGASSPGRRSSAPDIQAATTATPTPAQKSHRP
jgi:O-acetylserine/cysteine efflux transporter